MRDSKIERQDFGKLKYGSRVGFPNSHGATVGHGPRRFFFNDMKKNMVALVVVLVIFFLLFSYFGFHDAKSNDDEKLKRQEKVFGSDDMIQNRVFLSVILSAVLIFFTIIYAIAKKLPKKTKKRNTLDDAESFLEDEGIDMDQYR